MSNISDIERSRLLKQLVTLGDLIAGDDEWGKQRAYYNREYRKTSRILFPEMYKPKTRKPSQAFIRTLKPCNCGNKGWKFARHSDDKVSIYCPNCLKNSGEYDDQNKVRDEWNKLF